MPEQKAKLFIAVVVKEFGGVLEDLSSSSARPEGDWASFVNGDRDAAIKSAIKARDKWESKGFGPYRILVGTISGQITVPVKYEEVEL